MRIDFFENLCKEQPRNEKKFGLCDDEFNNKAYSDIDNPSKWVAVVINKNAKEVVFIAVDKCIKIPKKKNKKNIESTCDGMLIFNKSLFLIELKNRHVGGWQPEAIKQLKNTIKLLYESHDLIQYKIKKAYACNKKHPRFQTLDDAKAKDFFIKTRGFRLDVNSEIIIK